MKIIKNCISKELCNYYLEEIKRMQQVPVWQSSTVFWPEGIKNNITGSCIVANTGEDIRNQIISDERRMRLAEKPYTFYVPQEDYDALVEAIENPPKPSQGLIDLMNRPSPFKNNE